MITIGGKDISFSENKPNKEGRFLWKNHFSIEVIKVVYVPPREEYGLSWEGYYGVVEFRLRNVQSLRGSFAEIVVKKQEHTGVRYGTTTTN